MDKQAQFWSHEPTSAEKARDWLTLFKGIGEIALEFITKRFREEPTPNHSEHFEPYDHYEPLKKDLGL